MSTPNHPCVRCGVPVFKRGSACQDCRVTDPVAVVMSRNARAEHRRIKAKELALLHRRPKEVPA